MKRTRSIKTQKKTGLKNRLIEKVCQNYHDIQKLKMRKFGIFIQSFINLNQAITVSFGMQLQFIKEYLWMINYLHDQICCKSF